MVKRKRSVIQPVVHKHLHTVSNSPTQCLALSCLDEAKTIKCRKIPALISRTILIPGEGSGWRWRRRPHRVTWNQTPIPRFELWLLRQLVPPSTAKAPAVLVQWQDDLWYEAKAVMEKRHQIQTKDETVSGRVPLRCPSTAAVDEETTQGDSQGQGGRKRVLVIVTLT